VGLDDVMSTESAIVAAATAAVLSPRTRETVRRGAVYGVAGVLKAADAVTDVAAGVVRGVRGQVAGNSGPGASRAAGSGSGSSGSRPRTSAARKGAPRSSAPRSSASRSSGPRSSGPRSSGSARSSSRSGSASKRTSSGSSH